MATESVRALEFVGAMSLVIALLQFVMYAGGRRVYVACGAPDKWIGFRERRPAVAFAVEVVLAMLFAALALYAFSGAGDIPAMPLLPYGVATVALVYLVRGILLIPQMFGKCIYTKRGRDRLYSALAGGIGVTCAIATYRDWSELVRRASLQ